MTHRAHKSLIDGHDVSESVAPLTQICLHGPHPRVRGDKTHQGVLRVTISKGIFQREHASSSVGRLITYVLILYPSLRTYYIYVSYICITSITIRQVYIHI